MILVTGGSGFVATHTIRQLIEQQRPVSALVRSERQMDKVRRLGATPVLGDVTDSKSLATAMAGVDKVIHLAAVNRDKGAVTMQSVNTQGTINLVDASRAAGVKQLVNVVGLGADARKPYPLAKTQGAGVDYLMQSGVPYTVLEASVIFGDGDEFINTLAGLARIPPFMVVPGNGRSKFQPIAVQDVAACAIKALELPGTINQRLQICGSEALTLEAIIDAILMEMRLKRIKLHMPVSFLKVAVNLMNRLLPRAPITPSLLVQLGVDNVATENATESVFGLVPQRLVTGISYVHNMTFDKLIKRSLNVTDYR
ncbi:MAG TPA: NAD(P)H-binding protein [Anaerolineae bacterium]|jgi:NADH dehydrogenase